ncbi:MAG: peptidoglycan editing factor PgeF [Pseudomonadota bacterium]
MQPETHGWHPEWPVTGVGAWMSTRQGGSSRPPFNSLNLGSAVGDDPEAVLANRQRFQSALNAAVPVFLKQVHGVRVVRLSGEDCLTATGLIPAFEADASVCTEPGVACVVQAADCLPVLFAAPQGRAVAAAHAGWRGLAAGVLEATLEQVCLLGECSPAEVRAWRGPCIGPRHFEVGIDVRESFTGAPDACFRLSDRPAAPTGHWMADLPALALWRLQVAGMAPQHVHGGTWCTAEDASKFFSFRRDGVTGRMAAAIWRLP